MTDPSIANKMISRAVIIPADGARLNGDLTIPKDAQGIVLFAHGSGSSRLSERNRHVAEVIQHAGIATLLFDLLTPEEESVDIHTRQFRFDIALLVDRLSDAVNWITSESDTKSLNIGFFGASTGGGAALVAAAKNNGRIKAIVSRGGRPDLAGEFLSLVHAPVLLIVGGKDEAVISLNQVAARQITAPCKLKIVPGATHLFEEPGALDEVAHLAADFFCKYLRLSDHL